MTKRILFVPDCHVPFHDTKAFDLMLRAAKSFRPHVVVVLGDFLDCYSVSQHDKNPERVGQLSSEIHAGRMALAKLKQFGSQHHYIMGNHEDRLERYLAVNAPAVFSLMKVSELLRLKETGWTFTPYKRSYKLGKLHITHDTGTAGQNAARQSMEVFGGSTIIGHTHRMELSYRGRADGPPSVGAMFGWLGDFDKVDYMHAMKARRDWVHGFGVGYMEPNGVVHLQPVPIINGRCVVGGKLVK